MEDFELSTGFWIFIIVLLVAIAIFVGLYFLGKNLQKKQNEQQAMLDAHKQQVSLLVIDKKRIKIKDAQLPANIVEQIPKMSRRLKMPMAKVKVGPQIMTMFVDDKIYDILPVKKEVKAEVSGMYIVGVKGMHGTTLKKDEKKKGFWKRTLEKAQEKAGAKPIK